MKAKSIYVSSGFSILEIVLAFAVIILSLTAVIGLVFSGQSLAVDSQNDSVAKALVQNLLETARAQASRDFSSLISMTASQEGVYTKTLSVVERDDYTKEVTAGVNWQSEGKSQRLNISTLMGDRQAAIGGDTCSQEASGNWQNPALANYNLAQLAGINGTYPISGIDVYQKKLYVTVSSTANKTDPTFFIIDISNPAQPIVTTDLDNDSRVQAGPMAVRVAGHYAYLASASSYSRGQLQIIDLNQSPPQVIKTYKLPITNLSGSSHGLGKSIFYKNGFVYLGLTKTDSESEFNIIDVSNPAAPVLKGSYLVGNSINSIYIKGHYAYLAHPTDPSSASQEQLTVLDISNPSAPVRVAGFYYNGSSGGNGEVVYGAAGKLYLGRTASRISGLGADSIPEFFAFDDSQPTTIAASALGTISLPTPQSINGLIVKSHLAYLLTTNYLDIFNLADFGNITPVASFVILPAFGSSLDCEGDVLYAGSSDPSGNGYISIIQNGP